jgi:hypothetical protein
VLSTPPAFVLSQDQTLQQKPVETASQQQTIMLPKQKHLNWHWLIKHPVEFSKNNHTPETAHQLGEPAPGALVQLY